MEYQIKFTNVYVGKPVINETNGKEKPLEQKRVKGGFKTIRKWLEGAPEGSLLTVTEPNKPTLIISTLDTHGELIK